MIFLECIVDNYFFHFNLTLIKTEHKVEWITKEHQVVKGNPTKMVEMVVNQRKLWQVVKMAAKVLIRRYVNTARENKVSCSYNNNKKVSLSSLLFCSQFQLSYN